MKENEDEREREDERGTMAGYESSRWRRGATRLRDGGCHTNVSSGKRTNPIGALVTKGSAMRTVSDILLAIVVLTLAATAPAYAGGWGVGAGAHDGDFGFQLRKDFWLGGDISQITGQGSVYFHGKTTFKLDADYHFVISSGKGRFYPLLGLQFAFSSKNAEFGVNGGGGVGFMLTDRTAAFGEVKYVFGDWDGWTLSGGIYF
jgi:hypothetical protein